MGKILGDKELARRFWIGSFPVVVMLTTRLVALVTTDTSILTRLRRFLRSRVNRICFGENGLAGRGKFLLDRCGVWRRFKRKVKFPT
jgi:hypothetical protein